MATRVSYREAGPGDVAAIREVARDCWNRDYPGVVSRESIREGVIDWYGTEALRQTLSKDESLVVVAQDDAGAVGAFSHAVVDEGVGNVLRLYVHPEYRGNGIGSDLLQETVDQLHARGASKVRAMVLAENEPGNEFYRAAGFESIGESDTVIGEETYDERVYERAVG